MNYKKPLIAKKNVVNVLALIMNGSDTNESLSSKLKRSEQTISEHLSPLKKEGIVFTWDSRKHNKKTYQVDCDKIAELFFIEFLERKDFKKFGSNDWIALTFAALISAKERLLEKNPKKFDRLPLVDIFSEAMMFFYYRSKALAKGKKELALSGYSAKNNAKKLEEEFLEFLEKFYGEMQKRFEENKAREEKNMEEKGKSIRTPQITA